MSFDRDNLSEVVPQRKPRAPKHEKSVGYGKHDADGDLFELDEARRLAKRFFPMLGNAADGGEESRFFRPAAVPPYRLAVLLGLTVARAFSPLVKHPELFSTQWVGSGRSRCLLLVLPHPSGVSHFWNDKQNMERAAQSLRSAMQESDLILAQHPPAAPIIAMGGQSPPGSPCIKKAKPTVQRD